MVLPSLPVEVIGRIIELASGLPIHKEHTTTAASLLCVSAIFRAEVERLLYASLGLSRPAQIIQCFQTILKRPSAARAVRSLTVSLPSRNRLVLPFGGEQTRHGRGQLAAFARLVSSALKCMKGLRAYRITTLLPPTAAEGADTEPWLVLCSFQLSHFSTTLFLTPAMLSFLKSQPSIKEFNGSRCFLEHSLPADILPNVKVLAGPPELLHYTVPNRPVTTVCVSPQVHSPETFALLAPRLALSTGPVNKLDLNLADARLVCDHVLPVLGHYLPSLTTLAIPARTFADPTDPYDIYLEDAWTHSFAALKDLESVIVSTADPQIFSDRAGISLFDVHGMPGAAPGHPVGDVFWEELLNGGDVEPLAGPPNAGDGLATPAPPATGIDTGVQLPDPAHAPNPVHIPNAGVVQLPDPAHALLPLAQLQHPPVQPPNPPFPLPLPQLAGPPPPLVPPTLQDMLNQGLPMPMPNPANFTAHIGSLFATLFAGAALGAPPPPGLPPLPLPLLPGPLPPAGAAAPHPQLPHPGMAIPPHLLNGALGQTHIFIGSPGMQFGGHISHTNHAGPAAAAAAAGLASPPAPTPGVPTAAEGPVPPPPAPAAAPGAPPPGHTVTATFFGVFHAPPNGQIPQSAAQIAGAAISAMYDQAIPGMPGGMRDIMPPHPRREEALRQAQIELAPREREIIRRWSEACPRLEAVCFEMSRYRSVTWVVKEGVWDPHYYEE